jgi:hypothetical protein
MIYQAGRLIPFVGAGASMSVAWSPDKRGPSWKELVDQAAKKIGFDNPDLLRVRGTDLQILEYFRLKKHGSFTALTNWLVTEMSPPDEAIRLSRIHTELVELDRCRLFYTTNYDDFIERAFQLAGRSYRRIALEADIATSHHDTGASDIVKFHGDLETPTRMVLSESDYERRLTLEDEMDHRFRSDLLGRVVLFIGYSFRDWNVSYLFTLINNRFKQLPGSPSGRRAYITVTDPSDFEYELFRGRNIEVIPISGKNQAAGIAELLEYLRS